MDRTSFHNPQLSGTSPGHPSPMRRETKTSSSLVVGRVRPAEASRRCCCPDSRRQRISFLTSSSSLSWSMRKVGERRRKIKKGGGGGGFFLQGDLADAEEPSPSMPSLPLPPPISAKSQICGVRAYSQLPRRGRPLARVGAMCYPLSSR